MIGRKIGVCGIGAPCAFGKPVLNLVGQGQQVIPNLILVGRIQLAVLHAPEGPGGIAKTKMADRSHRHGCGHIAVCASQVLGGCKKLDTGKMRRAFRRDRRVCLINPIQPVVWLTQVIRAKVRPALFEIRECLQPSRKRWPPPNQGVMRVVRVRDNLHPQG